MTGGTRRVTVAAAMAVALALVSAQPAAAEGWPWWWWWPAPSSTPRAAQAQTTPSPSTTPGPITSATPTSTPTPTPSAAPSASPGSGGTPSPSPSASAGPGPSPSATPSPPPSPTVPTRTALPAPTPQVAVLSADSLQITGLQSIAVTAVPTASGPVKVIELVTNATTIGGLDLLGPCVGHARVHTLANVDRATGGLTLDVTAIQITVLGITITLAAADLPNGQLTLPGISLPPLPTDTMFLSVKMFALSIRAGAMSFGGPDISSSAC